jgi:hypothetical protein
MVKQIMIAVIAMVSFPAIASPDIDKLLEGCKQAVTLHENKDEQRTVMEFVMSPADTLLAGYCKGVIESYVSYSSTRMYRCGYNDSRICEEKRCSTNNWYIVADSIGSLESPEDIPDLNSNYQRDVEDALLYGCR